MNAETFIGDISPEQAILMSESLKNILITDWERLIQGSLYAGSPSRRRAETVLEPIRNSSPGAFVPVVWNEGIFQTAMNKYEAFVDTLFYQGEVKLSEHQCWMFNEGSFYLKSLNSPLGIPSSAELFMLYVLRSIDVESGIHGVTFIGLFAEPRNLQDVYIRILPRLRDGDPIKGIYAQFVAAVSFLSLPFVTTESRKLSWSTRKPYIKEGLPIPKVRVVKLRRVNHEDSQSLSDVDWHYQWIVRGHWRKQWHPSTEEHKVIWINPHIKGPDDKPLKSSDSIVYKAIR